MISTATYRHGPQLCCLRRVNTPIVGASINSEWRVGRAASVVRLVCTRLGSFGFEGGGPFLVFV